MNRAAIPAPLLLLLLALSPAAAAPATVSAPSPDALEVGSGAFVEVDVTATTDLESVAVEAVPSGDLSVSGENPAALDSLAEGESAETSFWIAADPSAGTGPAGLQLRVTGVETGSGESVSHATEKTLRVTGGGGPAALDADPVAVPPGGESAVAVTVDPEVELRNAELRLVPTGDGGVSVAGLDSRDLGTVDGETTAAFRVRADPGAEEGVYGFNVVAEHADGSVTRRLGVEVEGSPELVVSARAVGRSGGAAVTGNVSNVGTAPASGVVARLPNGSADAVGTVPPDGSRDFSLDADRVPPGTRVAVTHRRNGERVRERYLVKAGSRPALSFSEVDAERKNGHYVLTGTVANTGSAEAFGVLLRVRNASGATPVYPSRSYFVGSMEPDDFARFELTAESSTGSVPVAVEYGSLGRRETREVSFPLPSGPRGSESGSPDAAPLLAVIGVAAAGVLGAVAYSWRR